MKELLAKFVKKNRMYNPYSISWNTVEKTWNNGNGSLALFRFYPEKNVVLINSCLANKADRRKLDNFLAENGMQNWSKIDKDYGYPDYYFCSFKI